jgi:hypothetical protein
VTANWRHSTAPSTCTGRIRGAIELVERPETHPDGARRGATCSPNSGLRLTT